MTSSPLAWARAGRSRRTASAVAIGRSIVERRARVRHATGRPRLALIGLQTRRAGSKLRLAAAGTHGPQRGGEAFRPGPERVRAHALAAGGAHALAQTLLRHEAAQRRCERVVVLRR